MAQGNLKLKNKAPARVTKKQRNPKKAAPKILKPRRSSALKSQKLNKFHLGHLMKSTEKVIAGRVGHLELIKGSRREVEKEERNNAKLNKTK
ncbi:uncharacterized protein PRCAT00000434001 [Priceomyces carsonii]|uniref:uncharacterized protein n=1 Tax=Priceomyces carsonii TaxID=28549 RepID=UPI002ED96D80|nr:unnamed protein product [Priceomyces carsonii]